MAKTYTAVPTVTAGDVYTASAYNTYTSTNVSNLIVPPLCILTRTTLTQSFANGAFNVMTFDTETVDTDAMHDTSSNTSRITINTTGIYTVVGSAANASALRNQLTSAITLNGVANKIAVSVDNYSTTNQNGSTQVSGIFQLTAGDYIEFAVQPFTAAAAAITFGALCSFSAAWIGRAS